VSEEVPVLNDDTTSATGTRILDSVSTIHPEEANSQDSCSETFCTDERNDVSTVKIPEADKASVQDHTVSQERRSHRQRSRRH
jgi:hypothetical protein